MGEVIQLVVAPAFLLVAIAALLGVVTGRLGRVVDRARELEQRISNGVDQTSKERILSELRILDKRMRFNHWSINFLCVSALIVAIMVSTLFFAFLSDRIPPDAVALLFISAMGGIMTGIVFFIAEVYLATRTVRVQFELL